MGKYSRLVFITSYTKFFSLVAGYGPYIIIIVISTTYIQRIITQTVSLRFTKSSKLLKRDKR